MPFYYVQIAPYHYGNKKDGNSEGAEFMNMQRELMSKTINTGMVCINDVGDPEDKSEVGKRLAAYALNFDYGVSKDYSGPLYKSAELKGRKVRVYFDHSESDLTTREGGNPDWFELAGEDSVFISARAKIKGNTVVIRSKTLREPKQLRYGWSNIAQPNLIDKNGLPTSVFREENLQ